MAFYVYVSDQCMVDAQRHGQVQLVQSLCEKIQKNQHLTGFGSTSNGILKKQLGKHFRLIAFQAKFQEDDLVIFLRVWGRGSKEYDEFLKKHDDEKYQRRLVPFDEGQIRKIYEDLSRSQPAPPLPELDEDERSWLDVFSAKPCGGLDEEEIERDLFILEAEAWVKAISTDDMKKRLHSFSVMFEHLKLNELASSHSMSDAHVYWNASNKVGFLYLYFPEWHRLLLLLPLTEQGDAQEIFEKRLAREFSGIAATRENLYRKAARAYPHIITMDERFWQAIEENTVANMALSPEESVLLDEIRKPDVASRYPLFINGRAGSGKSTMLQYLAADYLEHALSEKTRLSFLYTTCSEGLLDLARQTVQKLLTSNYKKLLKSWHRGQEASEQEIQAIVERSFFSFQQYLLCLLLPEDWERFSGTIRTKYIGFPEFRKLWNEQFSKRPDARQFTPELAWHVIRTYIKGRCFIQDEDFSPEEFQSLSRGESESVTAQTYQLVYDKVWNSWYRPLCKEKGYWDDQDLAVCALNSPGIEQTSFAAIFCDEAQDFTPLELEVIFLSSVYSRRRLQKNDLSRVPFVFAGDPMQTLNPTGFRWESVKASFHERFRAIWGIKPNIHFRELGFSYRSNPGIVHFCNLIQLLRGTLLSHQGVQPQEAWRLEERVQIFYFPLEDDSTKEHVLRLGMVRIVPCEQNGESNYAKTDDVLKKLNQDAQGEDEIFQDVLSPIAAKGLEFDSVVLYRLAESVPAAFFRFMEQQGEQEEPEQRLALEYFFNRLYVAASRAKKNLFIVESREIFEGKRNFWKYLMDPDLVESILSRNPDPKSWENRIQYLVPGAEENWVHEWVDPLQRASQYAEEGRRTRDAYLMRQAALWFDNAEKASDAQRCRAEAEEFEGKLEKAGIRYRDNGMPADAFRCFWQGRHFKLLLELAARHSQFSTKLESRAAAFLVLDSTIDISFLQELQALMKNEAWFLNARQDVTWPYVFREMLARIVKMKNQDMAVLSQVYEIFRFLDAGGLPMKAGDMAKLAFGCERYEDCILIHQKHRLPETREYRISRARTTRFPENLVWWGLEKEHEEVIAAWSKGVSKDKDIIDQTRITTQEQREYAPFQYLLDAFVETSNLRLSLKYFHQIPSKELIKHVKRISRVLSDAVDRKEKGVIYAATALIIRALISAPSRSELRYEEKYKMLYDFISGKIHIAKQNKNSEICKFLDESFKKIHSAETLQVMGKKFREQHLKIFISQFYFLLKKQKKRDQNEIKKLQKQSGGDTREGVEYKETEYVDIELYFICNDIMKYCINFGSDEVTNVLLNFLIYNLVIKQEWISLIYFYSLIVLPKNIIDQKVLKQCPVWMQNFLSNELILSKLREKKSYLVKQLVNELSSPIYTLQGVRDDENLWKEFLKKLISTEVYSSVDIADFQDHSIMRLCSILERSNEYLQAREYCLERFMYLEKEIVYCCEQWVKICEKINNENQGDSRHSLDDAKKFLDSTREHVKRVKNKLNEIEHRPVSLFRESTVPRSRLGLAERFDFSFQHLRVTVFRRYKRVRIEQPDDFEVVVLNWERGELLRGEQFIAPITAKSRSMEKEWVLQDWDLTIRLSSEGLQLKQQNKEVQVLL